jgi:hypothetical protein
VSQKAGKENMPNAGWVGDLIKILWHAGLGMSLYAKRLERGRLIWPSAGGVVSITPAQLADRLAVSRIFVGIDHVRRQWRVLKALGICSAQVQSEAPVDGCDEIRPHNDTFRISLFQSVVILLTSVNPRQTGLNVGRRLLGDGGRFTHQRQLRLASRESGLWAWPAHLLRRRQGLPFGMASFTEGYST